MLDAFFTWADIANGSKLNDEIFFYDEIVSYIARQDAAMAYKYVSTIEKLIKSGKKVYFVNNLMYDNYITTKKMLVWLPLTMSSRVYNHYLNEDKNNIYKHSLLISTNGVMTGHMLGDNLNTGCFSVVRSAEEVMIARHQSKAILNKANVSNVIYENHEEFLKSFFINMQKLEPTDTVYIYSPEPPFSTMDEDLLIKILKRNNVSPSMMEHILEQYHSEHQIQEEFIKNHPLDITVDYINADQWSKEPVYLAINDRNTNIRLAYEYDEYQQHISQMKKYASQFDNVNLHMESMSCFKNMIIFIVPDKYSAAISMRDFTVDLDTNQKPIIDSIKTLLYIISPKNRKAVLANEREKDIWEFYKALIQ